MRSGIGVRRIAAVAAMAAILECAKLALAALPNIEAVTLLCALFGYSFGILGVFAAVVFVCIEPLIWGVGWWVVSYFLYWPLVALVFMLLGRARVKNRFSLTATALILTVWFGVLSSLVDVGLFLGYFDRFFFRFGIYYTAGVPFYIAQLATNAVLFPTLFPLLSRRLSGLLA